jgi:hypothetical protein
MLGGLSVSLLFAVGCGPAGLPKTYPANGTVVYKGGRPMKGGSVQFTSTQDPGLKVIGAIGDDGTFALTTIRDQARADGAPEGEYRVTVLPPLQGEHKGLPPIMLPQTYKVGTTDNQFKIQLNVPPPRS